MLQEIIVALIVAYAAWATVRRYFPKSALAMQCYMRSALAHIAHQCGHKPLAQQLLQKNDTARSSFNKGACGSCSGCHSKTCATSNNTTTTTTTTKISCTPQALQQTIRRQ